MGKILEKTANNELERTRKRGSSVQSLGTFRPRTQEIETMGIPPDIQEHWASLHYEVTLLHVHWAYYRELYGTSRKRVDVLNQCAGTFFNNLHWILLDHVQLTLAKLGDPPVSKTPRGRRENLVVGALIRKIKDRGDASLAANLKTANRVFRKSCDHIRDRRNTRIAHFDLDTMQKERAGLAAGPSRDEIESALTALRELMNLVEGFYCDNRTRYELTITEGDGESMLSMLARGLRHSELVKTGTIPWEDTQTIADLIR